MKRAIVILILLGVLTPISAVRAQWRMRVYANEGTTEFDVSDINAITFYRIIFEDGFEEYDAGSWPSSWTPDGNAYDNATNFIDDGVAYGGVKSLRLHGAVGSCWGAIAYREINVSAPFQIEVKIRNGDESLYGCHPFQAYIGLRKGTSWANPGRGLILFDGQGAIYSTGGTSGTVLESGYSSLAWYTVRILYERPSSEEVRVTYWINDVYKGIETYPTLAEEDLFTNLDLETMEGTAWFDDVKVTK